MAGLRRTWHARRPLTRWLLFAPYVLFPVAVAADLILGSDPRRYPVVLGLSFGGLAVLGIALSVRAATHGALDNAGRRPWRYLAGCFVLLIMSGVISGVTSGIGPGIAVPGAVPRVTPALVVGVLCRLLIVPVLLVGLVSVAPRPLGRRGRWTLAMDVTTVVGGGFMVIWYVLLGPALSGAQPVAGPIRLTTVAYPIGDLVLIFGVCAILLRGCGAIARRPLALLLAGSVSYLAGDLYLTYRSIYLPAAGSSVGLDLALLTPVFLMVAAAAEQCRLAGERRHPGREPRPLRPYAWLPYPVLVLGYALLATAAAKTEIYPWTGLVAGGAVMTFGVVARQIFALRENNVLASTDSLTGLANRVRLRETMTRATDRCRSTGLAMAVLQIDLDGFKKVNDSLSHEVGDEVLVAFAELLRRTIRGSDTAARLGGDEFAVVLENISSAADAISVAERIVAEAGEPVTVNGQKVQIQASIGIAVTGASTAELSVIPEPHELLHHANLAMYIAKRKKTHGWQLYAEGTAEADRAAAELREDLVNATRAGQLRVRYQPIVEIATGDVVGVEALVRWEHPNLGLLGPLAFIPLAEEIGMIQEVDAWVLGQATRQVRLWQDRLPGDRPLRLSVNVSASDLERETLVADVFDVLDAAGFDPRRLVLEVTESALVNDASAVPRLQALRARGVCVAIDDFGTGYSSLRYLTRLPVDILKLDRCFVAELNGGPEGSAVAEAVIRLGQILHLDIVAEGVEDSAQATELTLLGCRNAQGFHYGRPLTVEAIDELIAESGPHWPNLAGPGTPTGSRYLRIADAPDASLATH